MESEIRVPPLSESLTEATVGRWLKRVGDAVVTGQPVVELETEKVNLEVTADTTGVLEKILHQEGETVKVGEVLGTVGSAAPQPIETAAPPPPTKLATPPPPRVEAPPPAAPTGPAAEEPMASPVARRIASEYGIDLSKIHGTGPSGRVTREDVAAYMEEHPVVSAEAVPPPPTVAPPPAQPLAKLETAPLPTEVPTAPAERPEKRIRLSRRRLTIARRLLEAQRNQALLTTFNEIDMSAVMDLRRRRREAFQARTGVGLGFMSFFAKASVGALKAFPDVNSEMQGDELIEKLYYDIGIAVDTEGGLVVPVIRDADRKSFVEIERAVADLAKRARENQLTLEELRGGTFTITNGGVFGSLLSTPIVNPPQAAILGMHRIQERPIAMQGQVVIRPMMYVALTYDHRIIDGRTAVQFLVRVKELIEDPETLFLEA